MADLEDILRRKQRLIARCAVERDAVAHALRELERPMAIADRILGVVQFFRSHPLLVGAVVAIFVVARRRTSVAGLLARGISVWRLWRSLGTWSRRLGMDFSRRRQRNAEHAAP